jgi:hypothetical protein
MDPAERRTRIRNLIDRYNEMRALRMKEKPWQEQRAYYEKLRGDGAPPPEAMVCWGYTDFWASLNVLDAAQAIEKAVVADYEGSHTLFVNDTHNATGLPSRKLVAYCFPDVTVWKRPVKGTETLVSIERARDLIGFEPAYSIARFFPSDEAAVIEDPEPALTPAD